MPRTGSLANGDVAIRPVGLSFSLDRESAMEWPDLCGEIVTVTARVGDLLGPGDLLLARVSRTAAQTGAYLVSLSPKVAPHGE